MRFYCAAVCAALSFFVFAPIAAAQDVTFTSRDGAVVISGTLLSFDGELYRVDTSYGDLTLDSSSVICSGPGCPDPEAYIAQIRVRGSRVIGRDLFPALVAGFAAKHNLTIRRIIRDDDAFVLELRSLAGRIAGRFIVELKTTGDGFSAFSDDTADFVLASRLARGEEITIAAESGVGDLSDPRQRRILALDAWVPITARKNAISSLSPDNLAAILRGEIFTWEALGGPAEQIVFHQLAQSADPGALPWDVTIASIEHQDLRALSDAVARDPFALGVTVLSAVGNARAVPISGVCGGAIAPTRLSLKNEDYPLTRPLFIFIPNHRLPKTAREFLTYVSSDRAQSIVRQSGFVDLSIESVPISAQGDRLANALAHASTEIPLVELQRMIRVLKGRSRLSVSFRFEAGSTALDAQSLANISHVAKLLEAGEFDGKELLFAGFSDGEGAASANRAISLQRGEAVRTAVLAAAPMYDLSDTVLAVDAFGEALPMACDENEWGRQVNRRVELWISPAQR